MTNETVDKDDEVVETATPKKKRNKRKITIGVIAAVVVIGAALWVWHEQPSFCGAICHTPMTPYVDSYYNTDGTSLAYEHEKAGKTCLTCHPAEIGQQVSEAIHWVGGDYVFDASTQRLISRGDEYSTQEFCLSEACHDISLDKLQKKTSYMAWNPHDFAEHGITNCGDCHKMHEQSVFVCSQCHYQAAENVPEGWDSIPYREQR